MADTDDDPPLPKNISKKGNSYRVQISYKTHKFCITLAKLEKAIEKLEEFKKQIEEIKEQELNTIQNEKSDEEIILPKNISKKGNSYRVQISYKTHKFCITMPTVEKAIEKLEEYKKEIAKIKEEENTNTALKAESDEEIILTKQDEEIILPKNISKKRDSFRVQISHKTHKFFITMPTLEKAIEKLDEFKKQIEEIKLQEEIDHYNREITRDDNGCAIIPILNRKKDVIYIKVSDDKWHECMKYSWCITTSNHFNAVINGKKTCLHRFILNASEDTIIDFINKDKFDNRTENLRLSTNVNANHNRKKR